MMKKLLVFVCIVGLLFLGYFTSPTFAEKVNAVLYSSPCATPKTFSIGTIDPRFNISKDTLIADAQEAGSVWKNDEKIPLLKYDPTAKMTINMIYDQRQSLNSQINNLNSKVEEQKQNLKPEIADYERRVAVFKQKSADLNNQIEYWNGKGGAPEDEYNKLNDQQKALQQEANQLQQMAATLNQSTDDYNSQIQNLDQKVNSYNQALQYKPEEGLYVREGRDEHIEIYFNNTRQELIHTLAHEMGHAIGLQHNNNPDSIMYPSTTKAILPSSDDLTALAEHCQKRSIAQTFAADVTFAIEQLHDTLYGMLHRS